MSDLPAEMGKYKIVSEIARGGMGIVYKAVHPSLKRHVIIKKLSIRGNNSIKERFKREAQILLDLNNPNIVHLFDYFTEGSYHYIVLEFVDGMSLDKLLKKQVVLSPQLSMLIFRDSLRALKFAHDNGVVHRDIKPGNILISRHGDIKLADFGIASSEREEDDTSLTQSGVTLGTPSYMPPEQFDDSHSVDKRADIYAMGIMLYEMVTGTKPYAGNFAPETIAKIQKGKYIPPEQINKGIPKVICKLIKKMTRVKASKRYQDIEPILKVVDKYLKKYDTEEIRNSITEPMKKLDISVESVTYVVEGNYNFLRIELDKVNGIDLDMRVSALNTNLGEKIVIRILDYTKSTEGLEALGFTKKNLVKIKKMIEVAPVKDVKVAYASFGDKILADKALTKEEMLAKYKTLKKGDTIAVKFKSKINSVCKKKGCWMKMDLAGNTESFVKFKDYGFFVPLNADNSEAIVSGKAFVNEISVAELQHYEKDAGKSQAEIDKITKPKFTYGFQADGVLISK